MTCKLCKEDPIVFGGNKRKCYFKNSKNNWNCETVNQIRELEHKNNHRIIRTWYNEHTIMIIWLHNIIDIRGVQCLYVQWYKHRGKTESLNLMFDNGTCRKPKEKELLKIISYFKDKKGSD